MNESGVPLADSGSSGTTLDTTAGGTLFQQTTLLGGGQTDGTLFTDGVDDYVRGPGLDITRPTPATDNTLSAAYTVMSVFKLDPTFTGSNVWWWAESSSAETSTIFGFNQASSTGRIAFWYRNSGNGNSALNAPDADYRGVPHIAHFVLDPTDATFGARLYLDGVLIASGAPSSYSTWRSSAGALMDRLAASGLWRGTHGNLIKVTQQYGAHFTTALSAARVRAHALAFYGGATIYTDSFSESNRTLVTHTRDDGGTWYTIPTLSTDGLQIVSNIAGIPTGAGSPSYRANRLGVSVTDADVRYTLRPVGNFSGLAVGDKIEWWFRMQNAGHATDMSGYCMRITRNGSSLHDFQFIRRDLGGTETVLAQLTGQAFAAANQARIWTTLIGNAFTFVVDGVSKLTYNIGSDATKITAAGDMGSALNGTVWSFDELTATNAASITAIGVSLSQQYGLSGTVGKSLANQYVIQSALTAVGKSLGQQYGLSGTQGKSLANQYLISPFSVTTVYDNFNRADEGAPIPNALWTNNDMQGASTGLLGVRSNQLCAPGGAFGTQRTSTTFGPDMEAVVTVTALPSALNDIVSIYLRNSGTTGASTVVAATGTVTQVNGTTDGYIFYKYSTAGWVQQGTTVNRTTRVAVGDKIGFKVIGNKWTLYHWTASNNTWTSVATVTENTVLSAGVASLEFSTTANRVDDLILGTTVTIPVGKSVAQSYGLSGTIGKSLGQQYSVISLAVIGVSKSQSYVVKSALGKSLAQQYQLGSSTTPIGSSLANQYLISPFSITTVSDNFNRANEIPLGSTPGWAQTNALGAALPASKLQVLSNEVAASSSWANQRWATQLTKDQEAIITITNKGNSQAAMVAIYLRAGATTFYYLLVQNLTAGDNWIIQNTGFTTLNQAVRSTAVGDKIGFKVQEGKQQAWHWQASTNTWTKVVETTDTSVTGPGYAALEIANTAGRFDNWTVGSTVTAPIGKSIAVQYAVAQSIIGKSLAQQYALNAFAGKSLSQSYILSPVAVGNSLGQRYIVTTTKYQDEIVADGPLVAYTLTETTGTTARDFSGNGNDGTWGASVTKAQAALPTTMGGSAPRFSGTDTTAATVAIPSSVTLPTGSPITVEFWEYNTTANSNVVPFNIGNNSAFQVNTPYSDNLTYFDYGGFGLPTAEVTAPYSSYKRGKWTQVVLVAEAGWHAIYYDGELAASTFGSSTMSSAISGGSIGAWVGSGASTSVNIGYFAVYDYVLDEARIKTHYQAATNTTPVGASLSQSYVDRIAAGKSVAQSYGIVAGIGKSAAQQYAIFNFVFKARTQQYAITSAIGVSKSQQYLIGSMAALSISMPYSIFGTAQTIKIVMVI